MSKKNQKYKKTLEQQIVDKLISVQAFGESKKKDAKIGESLDKIYSRETYKTYKRHCMYFAQWVEKEHPEATNLKKAKKYVHEWLQSRVDAGLSSWTIGMEASALGKVFDIRPGDPDRFIPPSRKRVEIVRSRGEAARDRGFSEKNNAELIRFCRGTGLRRSEMESLKGGDCLTREQLEERLHDPQQMIRHGRMLKDAALFDADYFVYVRSGKGGKERLVPIIGRYQEDIYRRIQDTPEDRKVWQHVHNHCDVHGYRSDYATELYRSLSVPDMDTLKGKTISYTELTGKTRPRDEDGLDRFDVGSDWRKSAVYYCRTDEQGRHLDRRAMILASKALGHNRENVIATHYIRGL